MRSTNSNDQTTQQTTRVKNPESNNYTSYSFHCGGCLFRRTKGCKSTYSVYVILTSGLTENCNVSIMKVCVNGVNEPLKGRLI